MKVQDCIFCKIISKAIPAKIIDENDDILVIQDIHPKAPVHYLIIPKKHIKHVGELKDSDSSYVAKMMIMARSISKKLPGSQSFRLIINNGADSGQSVFHLHCHFISAVINKTMRASKTITKVYLVHDASPAVIPANMRTRNFELLSSAS